MGGVGWRRRAWLGCVSVAALALSSAASAQPAASPAAADPPGTEPAGADAGSSAFPAAFFAQYNPVTAADMVARVPGFELRDGDDRRGFGGASGNLLINGERPSSKTASSELLKRIPANSVIRIEVLSGTDAGSDVRGQTQVVNVVTRQAASARPATTFVVGARHIQYSERIGWTVQASQTMALSPTAELSLDLQAPNTLGRGEIRDILISGTGATTGVRYQVGRPALMTLQGAAALRWKPTPLDVVNLNLQYAPTWNSSETVQLEATTSGALRGQLLGETEYRNNYTAEAGADWEHRFTSALSAKLVLLASQTSVDQFDRFEIFTAPSTFLTRTQDRTTESGERIARGAVKWAPFARHALEFGLEGAFNYRDTTLDIVNQPLGGAPVPVPLAVSNARVEELRGEAFITDTWTATERLSIEAGLNYEVSEIAQTGDQEKERSFRFVKPRVSATYVLSPDQTLRFSLVRDVAQLDFAEFSSAVDFVNTSTIQGNPDLVPEKAWKARLEWEARFGPRTAVTLAAFADRVEDVHDLVVIGGLDAYGNIGDGSRVGAEVRAAFPLDAVGIPQAELRFNGLYQRTRVTDPITGEIRSFSVPTERQGTATGAPVLNAGNKDWAYVVNFRQTLPDYAAAWGFTVVQWAGRAEYRRAEMFEYVRAEPRLDLFVETTAIKPVTIRLYVNNIFVTPEERTRTFFVGSRATGVVDRVEERLSNGGAEGSRVAGILVSGRF